MKSLLVERLMALNTPIKEICQNLGTPGVSLGVLHENRIVYKHSFGYRDIKNQLCTDENTIYYVASLSKAFTAASIGALVEEQKLEWTSVVSHTLREFQHRNKIIREQATIADFLSHRTGLAPKDALWQPEQGRLSIRDGQILKTCTYLEPIRELRSSWIYNNWGYAIADDILERVAQQDWGNFLKDKFFDPLGMQRTITYSSTNLDNVAEGYMALADGTPYHVPRPKIEDGNAMEGAAGVQSTVQDMLRFYKGFMDALEDQRATKRTFTPNSPFKQVENLVEPQVSLRPSLVEPDRSYALGWIRTHLPGPLGDVGLNPMYVDRMPTVGKGIKEPLLVLHHQGSLPAFLSSVYLLPESKSAIVVLTNSMARSDTADWLGQLLLETLLDNPNKNDYVSLAKSSAQVSISLWPRMKKELKEHQTLGTPMKPLCEYTGTYYNIVRTWRIEVFDDRGSLYMYFQGNRNQYYQLDHYQFDQFSWLLTRNEDVHRARFPSTFLDFYIFRFETNDKGFVDRVNWRHDLLVPKGETFIKERLNEGP